MIDSRNFQCYQKNRNVFVKVLVLHQLKNFSIALANFPLFTVIRLILIQHKVGDIKEDNVSRALTMIRSAVAKEKKTTVPILVVLPECFNSPYGVKFFDKYAETIPDGYTSKALSGIAKELGIYLVAGSFPERDVQKPKTLYNTCTVWNPKGELITKHRKVHLFDVDIPNGITFKESDGFTPGNQFTIVDVGPARIGIGEKRFNNIDFWKNFKHFFQML